MYNTYKASGCQGQKIALNGFLEKIRHAKRYAHQKNTSDLVSQSPANRHMVCAKHL